VAISGFRVKSKSQNSARIQSVTVHIGSRIVLMSLESKPNKKQPYYGSGWGKANQMAMDAVNEICQKCGARAVCVHHIIPLSSFENPNDAHYPENLLPVCFSCHAKIHQEMRKGLPKKKYNKTS